MFYYYEKDGKILASDRSDLPYTPGTPRAGEPIYYLVLNRHCAITAMAFCTKTCLHLRGSARTRSSCTSSSYSPIT